MEKYLTYSHDLTAVRRAIAKISKVEDLQLCTISMYLANLIFLEVFHQYFVHCSTENFLSALHDLFQ